MASAASVASRGGSAPSTTGRRRRSSRASTARRATTLSLNASHASSCVVVLGCDIDATRRTSAALGARLGVRVVCVTYDGAARRRNDEIGVECADADDDDGVEWVALRGATSEEASAIVFDPSQGLLKCLNITTCALCVFGVSRELALGSDGETASASARRGGRAASVCGIPTVVATVPTTSRAAPIDDAIDATCDVVRACLGALGAMTTDEHGVSSVGARNWPRAHFPFPSLGRWASLGASRELAFRDDALAASVLTPPMADVGFGANADCWSLGGLGGVSHYADAADVDAISPERARQVLRDAFADADIYVAVSVPPRRRGKFHACKPGVLWRQEAVRALRSSDDDASVSMTAADANAKDTFGRSLPRQNLGDASASDVGARFVSQLATEKLVNDRRAKARMDDKDNDKDDVARRRHPSDALPRAFVLTPGTIVADDSPRGDVDVVISGGVAVSIVNTWPHAHALSLVDAVVVESLREHPTSGVPLWLCEAEDDDAGA